MEYKDCIAITMTALNYLLEHGWSLSNSTNFNYLSLKLNENGFILEEESRFNGNLSFGTKQVPLSPSYIIGMLFDGGEVDSYGIEKPHTITNIVKKLADWDLQNSISYIEIVNIIDKMRDRYSTGTMNSSSIIDMDYMRFKQKLSKVKKDESITFKNKVLNLGKLDYQTLTNIRLIKPDIARKIERFYQIEILLEKYCKIKILKDEGKINVDTYEYDEYYYMLNEVDLSKYNINWKDFCCIIKFANMVEKIKATNYWIRNKGNVNPKLTALGLDEMPLPGSPNVYKNVNR